MIYLAIILFLLSAFAKAQCDKKAFKEGGVEPSEGKNWLLRVPLSFLLGKWHRWDAIRIMSLCLIVSLALTIPTYYAIIFYIVHGLIFETLYRTK